MTGMNINIKVLKFGGGIFTDQWVMPILHEVINHELADKSKIIAVVSAIGKTTRGQLGKIPYTLLENGPDPREKDLLMASGENDAIALLTIYLKDNGLRAKSFTGQQAGILTDDNFGDANILDVRTDKVNDFLKGNDVAVVAGFQGVTKDGDVTTLGFNGSDTTAFYMAYHFNALSCTLYKDVNGVYTQDPKTHPDEARLYKYLNYKEVLDGTAKGIIHEKALALCRDKEGFPPVIIRNINLSQHEFTTICNKQTEVYR